MKKYLMVVTTIIITVIVANYLYFYNGVLYIPHGGDIDKKIWIEDNKFVVKNEDNKIDKFSIKGVDLGLGIPGHFATERAINKETYLRWFKYIKEMGANTIRVYTIQGDDFYEALYEYNTKNQKKPLYLIHGVWLDDQIHISSIDAFNKKFKNNIKENAYDVINAIHGRLKLSSIEDSGKQSYKYDVSDWVIGYILGIEWEPQVVEYTNMMKSNINQYKGKYTYTTDASPFEIFLAGLIDEIVDYESKRYGTHRNFAISNWPMTDPLKYSQIIEVLSKKKTTIDTEKIKTTEAFKANQFASYHIYPYYPEYKLFENEDTKSNLYKDYIANINKHHSMPVVISEFGVPSSRGKGAYEQNRTLGRDQGRLTEEQQGKAIVSLYNDIMSVGSVGGFVFIWQNEWFKKTWNTELNVDLDAAAYWNDYQNYEQNFGLLAFDPGKEKSVCYTDGDKSEWKESDKITENDKYSISSKYDEKYVYFKVDLKGRNPEKEKICIPIDTIQKLGSKYINEFNVETDRKADFVISIDGRNNSKILVQERYDSSVMTMINYNNQFKNILNNPPSKDSANFITEKMLLNEYDYYNKGKKVNIKTYFEEEKKDLGENKKVSQIDYTGNLIYGDGNPESKEFNSLSDYCFGKDCVEIRIPWGLLNFYNPSIMQIHDDYYEHYGVEPISIDKMYIGVGTANSKIELAPMKLKGWGKKVTYHERLKESYYILKDYWNNENKAS